MHTQGTPAGEVGGKKVREEKGQQKASSVSMWHRKGRTIVGCGYFTIKHWIMIGIWQ